MNDHAKRSDLDYSRTIPAQTYYTIEEVAIKLRLKYDTARRWVVDGLGRGVIDVMRPSSTRRKLLASHAWLVALERKFGEVRAPRLARRSRRNSE